MPTVRPLTTSMGPLDIDAATALTKLVLEQVAITASKPRGGTLLRDAVRVAADKVLRFRQETASDHGSLTTSRPAPTTDFVSPVLILLAAGKGTRFGQHPKCIQPVLGTPLARHSIDAFRNAVFADRSFVVGEAQLGRKGTDDGRQNQGNRPHCDHQVIVVVGYKHEEVSTALGGDNTFVVSENPAGGTAFATFEAFSVPGLLEANPLLVITMGDRVVPAVVFKRLIEKHGAGETEAALTFLTARYEPPKHRGKGRVLRNAAGNVVRIVEQSDIAAEKDPLRQNALEGLTEGNCPLYAIRAATLFRLVGELDNANAQGQYYLTDIVARIAAEDGRIRTITTNPNEPEYDVLCSDVTRPQDLAILEGMLRRQQNVPIAQEEIAGATSAIVAGRPPGQVASIARQLEELHKATTVEKLGFAPDRPVAIGISGGRLRIAFMHPDMGRFFGPAWQMPIGAADVNSGEQIVVLAQSADDKRLHLHPLNPKYRENVDFVAADDERMYPGENVADWHAYEGFGTRMSESLLLSLGYFSDEEIETRRTKGVPLPPPSLRVSDNMRRPFALVGNAIASMRTLRDGHLGAKVQAKLGRAGFGGLRIACVGGIPMGGFSSSSALTVATKNALNSLFDLGIPADVLVHLACQAEYGTGVRAGSLDQATEQKGVVGQGTLISSNPRDNYKILGTYRVPADRFKVIFPYTVERDRTAWRWSWGMYAETAVPGGPLTTNEVRKMTGKIAEIAAILTQLPLDTDFFKEIEADLLKGGHLSVDSRRWICGILKQVPLLIPRDELQRRVAEQRDWYIGELVRVNGVDRESAARKTDATFSSLFAGWREPVFRREVGQGNPRAPSSERTQNSEFARGVPIRAMLAYLFCEVAKNFSLIHHPEEWIEYVARSQQGDRSVEIDPGRLPERSEMEGELEWEKSATGPERLNLWLDRHGAIPYDFNQDLDDRRLGALGIAEGTRQGSDDISPDNRLGSVTRPQPAVLNHDERIPEFNHHAGGNFFRGLALIDLAEAMLKRAFGANAVAVRVNAAGQGDYFQVHIDTTRADVADVKQFLRMAFYRRFGLSPDPEFVETNSGGGAVGVRMSRFDEVEQLVRALRVAAAER